MDLINPFRLEHSMAKHDKNPPEVDANHSSDPVQLSLPSTTADGQIKKPLPRTLDHQSPTSSTDASAMPCQSQDVKFAQPRQYSHPLGPFVLPQTARSMTSSLDWLHQRSSFQPRPDNKQPAEVKESTTLASGSNRDSMNQHVIPFSINRPFSTASTSLTTTFRNDPDEPSSPFPSSSPSRLFTSSPCREDQNSSDDPFLSSPSRLQQTVLPSAPEQIKVDSQSSRALFLPNAHSHTESPGEIQHISFTPSRIQSRNHYPAAPSGRASLPHGLWPDPLDMLNTAQEGYSSPLRPYSSHSPILDDVLPPSSPPEAAMSSSPVKSAPFLHDETAYVSSSPFKSLSELPIRSPTLASTSTVADASSDVSSTSDPAFALQPDSNALLDIQASSHEPQIALVTTAISLAHSPVPAREDAISESASSATSGADHQVHFVQSILVPDSPRAPAQQIFLKRKRSDEVTSSIKSPSSPTSGDYQARTDDGPTSEHVSEPTSHSPAASEPVADAESPKAKRAKRDPPALMPPPTPARPTMESQRQQHKKLSTPFRSPLRAQVASTTPALASSPLKPTTPSSTSKGKDSSSSGPSGLAGELRTRPVAQFKSPFSQVKGGSYAGARGGANSLHGPSTRLTPAIQAIEARVHTLKRALKIREDERRATDHPEKPTLEQLVRKWREAGREIAWEVWNSVKDTTTGGEARGGWASEEKKGFQDSWGWDESAREAGDADGKSEDADADMPSDTEKSTPTLGTMLRQLRIDPATLGWDDDEGDFVDRPSA